MRLSAFTLVMALALFFAGVGRTTDFSITTGRLSSELTAKFQLNQPIYIEVFYSGTERLRFQAQAYRDGKSVDVGQLMNGAVPYPAGVGSALVWVAFRYPAAADEIRITTYDDNWKPLDTQSLQAKLQWSGKNEGPDQAKPSWVRSLQAEQNRIALRRAAETKARSDVGLLVSVIGLTIMAGVPGYFVIQFITAQRLRGRWRLASFAPLALTVPATGYAIYAVVAGCSLWPSVACVPVAFIYLLALYAAGSLIRFYPSAASPLQNAPV